MHYVKAKRYLTQHSIPWLTHVLAQCIKIYIIITLTKGELGARSLKLCLLGERVSNEVAQKKTLISSMTYNRCDGTLNATPSNER